MSIAIKTDVGYPSPRNVFGYVIARIVPAWPRRAPAVDGQLLPVTALQPAVPVTRGEKTIDCNAREQALAVVSATQPAPPRRAPIHWQQTRLEAPAALEASRSRTDMLSEKIARQQG